MGITEFYSVYCYFIFFSKLIKYINLYIYIYQHVMCFILAHSSPSAKKSLCFASPETGWGFGLFSRRKRLNA